MKQTLMYTKPMLVGLSGPLKGKKLKLKGTEMILGTGEHANIKVPGGKVSETHAVLEYDPDGYWVIRNKSEYGVLVNQLPVDVHDLMPNDTIQIGDLVVFRMEAKVKQSSKSESNTGDSAGKSGGMNPLVVAGISVYLLAIAGVALFLLGQGGADSQGDLSKQYVAEILKSTEQYLLDDVEIQQTNLSKEQLNRLVDEKSDSGATYYAVVYAENPEEKERLIKGLLDEVQMHFYRGWMYEESDNYRAAINEYREVQLLLPNIKLPAAQVALRRHEMLRKENR